MNQSINLIAETSPDNPSPVTASRKKGSPKRPSSIARHPRCTHSVMCSFAVAQVGAQSRPQGIRNIIPLDILVHFQKTLHPSREIVRPRVSCRKPRVPCRNIDFHQTV